MDPLETHPHAAAPTTRARTAPRRWWPWLLAILVVAAGALAFTLMPSGDTQQQSQARQGGRRQGFDPSRPIPVMAVPAKTGEIGVTIAGLGTVTPLATVTVKSRIDGQLMNVVFREGQLVRSGDLLAEIDPRAYQVQLAQAEGQMARDQALLKNALIDLERYRVLFQQDSIAKQQLDTQDALVRQYEATLKVDQAAIDGARLQLTYCRITAPVSGRLGLRQVDAGNIVHASDQNGLVVITRLQPIAVVFAVPEDNVPEVMKRLQAGEKLPVDAYDRGEKTRLAMGTLVTVDNQIDPATGTVKLKAQFANDDFRLFPNQFVNARMLLETRRGVTLIPTAAVQRGTMGTFVYVIKPDDTATVRPIRLGPVQGETIAIEAGLAPGEPVVVDGADKLREGAKVERGGRDAAPAKDGARKGSGRKGGGRKGGDAAAPAASGN